MYSQILVAFDGSQTASAALDAAVRLARDTGAQLQPLFVMDIPLLGYDMPGFDPSVLRDAYVEQSRLVCADADARLARAGLKGAARTVETEPGAGDVAECIVRSAADCHADLIVIGTHGRRGVQRLMLGSVAERVLRNAHCPVFLMPARAAAVGTRKHDSPVANATA